jgi:hypothetical protein
MNIKELRKEVDDLGLIFKSVKYYELDFKYLNSIKYEYPIVYSTFFLFIERIFHSVCVILIINLCKLFDEREKTSLIRTRNRISNNYNKTNLKNFLSYANFEMLFERLNSKEIELIICKLRITRDEYYAHLDKKRTDFVTISISSNETEILVSIAEDVLKKLELYFFKIDVDYNLTINELGHNIFERLQEWEEYREKYGFI